MKRILIAIALVVLMLFSACQEKEISNSQEITHYSYTATNDYGTVLKLRFNEPIATISIKTKHGSGQISGKYVITQDELCIIDDMSGIKYRFSYELSGDRVILIYENSQNILYKDDTIKR